MCKTIDSSIDTRALRGVLGAFPTGVAVVTTAPEGKPPAGMTINSFHSISLEPALVGWCIDRGAASYGTFSRCSEFTLSFLNDRQQATATRFATRGADKFAGLDTSDPAGPILAGACAWLRCRLYRQMVLGDHLLLVGQVTRFGLPGGRPLVFAGGSFGGVSSESQQVARDRHRPAVESAA